MFAATGSDPALARAARKRHGVLTREHLTRLGATADFIDHQVAMERWTAWGSHTILLHNSVPNRRQLMTIAVDDAGPDAALGSHTTLELAGFRSFAAEASDIHLVVPRGAKPSEFEGVVVHESRRLGRMPRVTLSGLPCVSVSVSAIDAAAWQPWPRFAMAQLAAVVQQQLSTVDQLDGALAIVGRVRHKQVMRLALVDIGGGAQALSEIDVADLCRRFNLAPPDRQVVRYDSDGRKRYLDCEWDTPIGKVVLEIDGAHHLTVEHWEADMKRERQVVIGGRMVLRASAHEARFEQEQLAADLRAIGVPDLSEAHRVRQA